MAQRLPLPEFGNWQDEVPYTDRFENARKGKGRGKPNSMEPQDKPTSNKVEGEAPKGSEAVRSKNEQHLNREVGDLRRSTDSVLQYDAGGQRISSNSPLHYHGGLSSGDTPKRATRQSTGSDRSIEHSPLHPHSQAVIGGKSRGVSSPSWERKGSSQGSSLAPLTPGRSRLRSVTRGGDETPDHGAAVPKFGDWDEGNPASADGFTAIFNRVLEEKQVEAGKLPASASETPHSNGHKQPGNENSKSCCCFPWSKK